MDNGQWTMYFIQISVMKFISFIVVIQDSVYTRININIIFPFDV